MEEVAAAEPVAAAQAWAAAAKVADLIPRLDQNPVLEEKVRS